VDKRQRAFQDVLQFAHVAGKGVVAQQLQRLGGDLDLLHVRAARQPAQDRAASSGMSSARSRSAGTRISITLMR
jgi:hypothetical protein